MNEFLIAVGARGRGADQFVRNPAEFVQKSLIGLASKRAQDRGFVERGCGELARVDIPIPHPLIIGEQNLPVRCSRFGHVPDICRCRNAQLLDRIATKLLSDTERKYDEGAASSPLCYDSAEFQLLDRLPKPE